MKPNSKHYYSVTKHTHKSTDHVAYINDELNRANVFRSMNVKWVKFLSYGIMTTTQNNSILAII